MADTVNSSADNDIILDIDVRYEDAINGIVKYKKAIDDIRKSNADFKKEVQEGTKTEEQYNKAVAANAEITAQYNAKIKALRTEIQNNIKDETNRTGSIKKLQAEIASLVRKYEVLGNTEDDLAKKRELSDKISALQQQLNNENAAIGRFYGQVGNYEAAIKSALGLNNEFANSFISLGSSTATGGKGIDNITTSVKAFGKALLGLLTNPVFVAIAGIVGVGVAFKFWLDYNKGLEEATRLTKQFTKLSGSELKSYRNEIQGVSDAFGKDFKEVLEATNAVSKQFGISQQEALKLVKDGFIAGADANGEYLQTLKEYPAYFKEAGISADQFIAIVAETGNQGIFSDKGIDAIKEANIRLRELNTSTASALDGIGISSKQVQKDLQNGSKTTFEVMQEVSKKLNEFPDQSKQVGTAIADIFGGAGEDAGLQYLRTLKDIDTNLDEVKAKTGELGEIQERQMNANIELQNVVSALFDQTGGTFETMIGNAKVFATESLTSIIKGLISVANWFITLYNNVERVRFFVNAAIVTFKTLFEIISVGLKSAIDGFKSLGGIITALTTGDAKLLAKTLTDIPKTITNNISDSIAKISSIASDAIDEVNNGKIEPIEIPVNVVTPDMDEKQAQIKQFYAMNKKQLEAWINDEKNATSEYLKLAKDIYAKRFNKTPITDAMKKAAEAERKAAIELARFRLEQEIKSQKELSANTEKSYDERLLALNKYQNLQRAYIEKDQEWQLKQADLTASQRELIKEKSRQKLLELDKELADSSLQIMKEEEARQNDILTTDIQNRLAIIKQGSDEELALRLQQLDIQRQAEIDAAEKTGADKAAINAKYFALEQQELQKQTDYLNAQIQTEYDNQILQAQLKNQNTLALEIASKQAELASLSQLQNESDADYLNRQLTIQAELKRLEEERSQFIVDNQVQTLNSLSVIAGGVTDLLESFAEDNEAFAAFAKAVALFQIGLDTASALTAGIKQAQSVPFPGNLAAIATTIATILSNVAKAKKYLTSEKQPKAPSFATGGYVSGPGSGTSDSINANLSNGESVLNARATAMFSPVLSAFNQIGGGVPISVQDSSSQINGEEMLSRSFAKALLNMPNPVVSVQEIDNVNNRITVLEESRSL